MPWKSAQPPCLEASPFEASPLAPSALETSALEADLDIDGRMERVIHSGAQVKIVRICAEEERLSGCEDEDLWNSPPSWQISQVRVTELNHDRVPEVTLLVWRPFKSWPIDRYIPHGGRIEGFHNRDGLSNHLVLIGWKQSGWRELWAGSALVHPLLSFASADLNGDGFADLAAVESDYSAPRTAAGSSLSVWEWNGFGFTRLARVAGTFREVGVAHAGKDGYFILTTN